MNLDEISIADSRDPSDHMENHGYFIRKGRYYSTETVGKRTVEMELSNFVMKSVFHLNNGTNNSQRIIFIQRHSREKHLVEVFSSEMKPESFETVLKSKRCTFYGSGYEMKRIFAHMMDNEKEADILHMIGWHPEHRVYAFADAVVGEDNMLYRVDNLGIVDSGSHCYYLPAFGYANLLNEDYKIHRLYKFCRGVTDFRTWSELYYKAYGSNGVIGILFTILTIYRDIVFDQLGFFPFIFLFGDAGTGKTQFTEKLLRLFGNYVIGTSLNNATTPGLSRTASQKSNSLVYLKEYTNETEEAIQDFILTAYDGAGRTIGLKTTDNRTKTYAVRSGLIFDGNHLPTQKTAILTRMILLYFENNTFNTEQTEAFHELKRLAEEGFGGVLLEILKLRPAIETNFREVYLQAKQKVRSGKLDIPERMMEHLSLIYAMYETTKDLLEYPFQSEQLKRILADNAESHNALIRESSVINIFWEAFAYSISKGQIFEFNRELGNQKASHYRIVTGTDENVILQIHYKELYPYYVRYCKDNSLKFLDKSSLGKLLTSDANKSFIKTEQKNRGRGYTDYTFGFCYQFAAKYAENRLLVNDTEIIV